MVFSRKPPSDFFREFRGMGADRPQMLFDLRQTSIVPFRRHVVQDGDTLMSLAQRYYGDRDHFQTIFHGNREQVHAPDRLTPGTVLVIPDLPAKK